MERISQCFPKKLQEQNCKHCRQKVTPNIHLVSKRRVCHPHSFKNNMRTLTDIPGFLFSFIPNTRPFYTIGNINKLIEKLVFSVSLYYNLCK